MTNDLTVEMANQYALKAMMCSRAYVRDTDRTQFPVEGLGWKKVDIAGNPVPADRNSYTPCFLGRIFSSLQFDIWEKMNSEETIIAFKGTDEKIDWPVGNAVLGISVPYKSAKKQVCKYIELNPRRNVSLTGHSLGGGLALSVSVWRGLDALVFNSSPRIFDGLRNMNEPADRKAVFQKGDILQILRATWPKFLEKVPAENIVQSHFDYHGENNHRMDLMAEGILRLADDPEYIVIAQTIPVKVTV
ncbi:MAG: hypothetical protein KGZ88_02640 [Methylomicrobium sp.]|nr:hypothetical protein [Methylomicrobium sp.]